MILSTHGIIGSSVTVASGDADALAFITAAAITDTTQKSAINTLVTDLKTANIWTKMAAIYPFVGGTVAQHRFNLKDPRAIAGAFYLIFNGGWTHSATGVLPNGTTGYVDTQLSPRLVLPNSTFNHLSYYSRTNTAVASEYSIGTYDGVGSIAMILRRDTNNQAFYSDVTGNSYRGAANNLSTNSQAFYIGTQQGSNIKLFRNTTLAVSNTYASSGNISPSNSIFLGSLNNQGNPAGFFTNKECAFASIGDGLTDTEAANFYTAVQAYNTTLNRQV